MKQTPRYLSSDVGGKKRRRRKRRLRLGMCVCDDGSYNLLLDQAEQHLRVKYKQVQSLIVLRNRF